jgi:micrococcal nuclease
MKSSKYPFNKIANLLLLLFISSICSAEYLDNLSIKKIIDGDTVHVFHQDETYKVRLIEIDAPERNQPYGKDSTDYLKLLLNEGKVDVEIFGTDRYGRKLGRLYCKGSDINREMVTAGYAWVYDDYVTDRSFYENQSEARELKKGLWKDSNSIPPWEWRKRKKQ